MAKFATVNIRGKFGAVQDLKAIATKIRRREFMLKLGKQIKDLIQGDTRSGFGVNSADNKTTLKSLSPSYVEFKRKQAGKAFSPGRFFRQGSKSNLSLTGQMLDAMDFEAREGFIKIFVKDTSRTGYGKGKTNAEVAELVEKNGRRFLAISNQNREKIEKEIQREARNIIRRQFSR